MRWIFGAYECHYAWPLPEYSAWFDGIVCPCLSWCPVAFSRAIVVELDSEGSIVSLTFTRKIRSLARVQIWNVRAPPYPFVQFKFSVFGLTYVRTGHTRTRDLHAYKIIQPRLCTWSMHAGAPEVKQLACRLRSPRFGLTAGDQPKLQDQSFRRKSTGVVVSQASNISRGVPIIFSDCIRCVVLTLHTQGGYFNHRVITLHIYHWKK